MPLVEATYIYLLNNKKRLAKYKKSAGRKSKTKEAPLYYVYHSRNNKVRAMVKDRNCRSKNWRLHVLDQIIIDEINRLATVPEYYNEVRDKEARKND